jgi:phosphohistidine swiveling domain-containing protein
VLARELGIPAVVGARGALTEIPDGALIDVDAVAGVVRLVAEP